MDTSLVAEWAPRFSFSPTKSLAKSTKVRASVLSLWTCNIMRLFSLEFPVVESKYVFEAENDLSLTTLVAGMTRKAFPE